MIRLLVILVLLTLSMGAAGIFLGDQKIPPAGIVSALVSPETTDPATLTIVRELRLPRSVLAVLVGIALAVAGTITQAVMRNPLAEPGLLGINAGAALAGLLVLVALPQISAVWLPWAGFGGALGMSLMIYVLSWRGGVSSDRIILIGIGLSALAGAASGLISAFGDVQAVQRAMVWLAGSLHDSRWVRVEITAIWLVLPLILILLNARELDLLAYDDFTARGLGQRVEPMRAIMILLCTVISGAAVAAAGLIGFVGLIAPHVARRMIGARHRMIIPVAALVGAILVSAGDILGRTVIAPAQLPVGLVTALLGAPFFGFLMWKRQNV